MATSSGLRENDQLNNMYRLPTKDGATETGRRKGSRAVKVLGCMGSIEGCAGVLWGSRDGTPTWNTYQLDVCAPTADVGWWWEVGWKSQ